jgi:hypothetical protein
MNLKEKRTEITLPSTGVLIIPAIVRAKINYLCREINKVEWSGMLFYSLSGDGEDVNNITCVLKDIYPMHKGSSGYTEYEYNEQIVEVMSNNPELMEYRVGHIHSHHSMNTFFSGTDMEELHDNAPNHHYYLSVIVNNYGEVCAKTVFIGEREVKSSIMTKFKNSLGNVLSIPFSIDKTEEVLNIINMTVKEGGEELDKFFVDRVTHIKNYVLPVSDTTYSPAEAVEATERYWRKFNASTNEWDYPTRTSRNLPVAKTIASHKEKPSIYDVYAFIYYLLTEIRPLKDHKGDYVYPIIVDEIKDEIKNLAQDIGESEAMAEEVSVTLFDVRIDDAFEYILGYDWNDMERVKYSMAIFDECIKILTSLYEVEFDAAPEKIHFHPAHIIINVLEDVKDLLEGFEEEVKEEIIVSRNNKIHAK